MAKLYVIMGKSSTGKDTVYRKIVEKTDVTTITMYTTRPMRVGETDGREYYFIDEDDLAEFDRDGRIIELRAYNTVHGIWKYLTVDDGQINLETDNRYLIIATLEAYEKYLAYYGKDIVVPIYIEVDDRTRIHRALQREDAEQNPKYKEMCRRFIADEEDFSEEKLKMAGIDMRYDNYDLDICVDTIIRNML
jgi:guanylate kinase